MTSPAPSRAPLLLASRSPRRRKILAALGVAFEVVVPDAAEVVYADDARRAARENAARKSAWCRARFPDRYSLAADTLIEFRGRCVGKARSLEEARAFLEMFSGMEHTVYTAVALARPMGEPELILAESRVRFRRLEAAAIAAYLERVRPLDRAGAYDIDEGGEALIAATAGSRTNIMGLPSKPVAEWLRREGLL